MPALILARGSEGLWVALALTVAPLIALVAPGGADPAQREAGGRFRRAALLAVAGISIWANVGLAADVAAWQGAPRWQGIAVAVVAAWLFADGAAVRDGSACSGSWGSSGSARHCSSWPERLAPAPSRRGSAWRASLPFAFTPPAPG
jgi:hypothetical protein